MGSGISSFRHRRSGETGREPHEVEDGVQFAHIDRHKNTTANGRVNSNAQQDASIHRIESRQERSATADQEDRKRRRCNIQPHTDEWNDEIKKLGGFDIGDIYESAKYAAEWALPENELEKRPYLSFVKRISLQMPQLEYLAHWMEVTCDPLKWPFISQCGENREQRAQKCSASVIDFYAGQNAKEYPLFGDAAALEAVLREPLKSSKDQPPPIRFVIAEDLSRDLVEALGRTFDIDPLFFRSQIGDYLFTNARDRWTDLPDLDAVARKRSFFTLAYLRARYFQDSATYKSAEEESGSFNVLRRLDSDRNRTRLQDLVLDRKDASVTLMRSKAGLWLKPRKIDEPIVAVILVDPTVAAGSALWRGYRSFVDTPSMYGPGLSETPSYETLFDNVRHSIRTMADAEIAAIRKDHCSAAVPLLRHVLSDWRIVLKYMVTVLNKVELQFDKPHWADEEQEVEKLLKKLSPWQRNLPFYQSWIDDAIDRVFQFPPALHDEVADELGMAAEKSGLATERTRLSETHTRRPETGLLSLLHDFRLVQQQIDNNHNRIKTIQTVVTNVTNVAEAKRAGDSNKNVLRLTLLGIFFLPLNATSSFLSMSPDIGGSMRTVKLFFEIGVPLTVVAFLTLDLWREDGFLREKVPAAAKWIRNPGQRQRKPSDVKPGQTFAWNLERQQTVRFRSRG